MKFQIRMADSGHAEELKLQKIIKGQHLINRISTAYNIAAREQLLVTKTGHFIRPQDTLTKVLLTELKADKTMVQKEYKQGVDVAEQRIPCIYVFNLKEMKQPIEKVQQKSSEYWKEQLKKRLECLTSLRPKVSIYAVNHNQYSSTPLQLLRKVEEIAKAFNTLEYSWGELSEICTIIQQVVELCSHQKKSLNCLTQKLQCMIKEMSKRAQKIIISSQQLKNPAVIDDKSLRQNSGCFQNRKKQEESALCFGMKMMQFKRKSEQKLKLMKDEIKGLKNKFRQCDSKSFHFGKLFNSSTIQAKLSQERSKYKNVIQMLNKYQQTQQPKLIYSIQNEVKLLERLLQDKAQKTYEELYQCLAQHFRQFSEMKVQNKNYVKQNYQFFMKWKKFIDDCNQELGEEQQAIAMQIGKIPCRISREPSLIAQNIESEEVSFLNFTENAQSSISSIKYGEQAKRRIQFYKRMHFIERYLQKLCTQEEQNRKKYARTNSNIKQKLLKNCNVPTVQIDYQGTTDLELFRSNKQLDQESATQFTIEQFMISEYVMILDKIKMIVGMQVSVKLKNMQEIIKSMSQIFMKVYTDRDQQKNTQISQLNIQIQENEGQVAKMSETFNDYHQKINKYQLQLQQKDELISALQRAKADQLAKEKIKYEKIVASRKELESKLNSQMRANEDLLNALNAQDEEISVIKESYEEIKILLGEKQVTIIKMQKQLFDLQNQMQKVTIQPDNLGQKELKSAVLQNFGRKQDEYIKLNQEIKRLNQEIEVLQHQNEQLEAENQQIASELHKIIASSPSEESETQTEEPFIFKKEDPNGISIGQEIHLGQKAIFMPFNSNVYVGVHHKDKQKTICNMSGIQQRNYLLDLQSFEQKAYNLLNECSFVVVVEVSELRQEGNDTRVRGKIRHLLGFEQDSLSVRDYAGLLRN